MNTIPELTTKRNEALDTLVDLFRMSRRNAPGTRIAFLGVATLCLRGVTHVAFVNKVLFMVAAAAARPS